MSFHGGKLLLCDCGWRRLAPCPLSGDVSVWIGKCDPAMQGIEVGDVVVVSPGPPAIAGCYTVTSDVQRETPDDPIVSNLTKIDDPDGCASQLCSPPCPPNCVHCPQVITLTASINASDCVGDVGSCGPHVMSGSVQMIRQGNNCVWSPSGWIVEPQFFDPVALCKPCNPDCLNEAGTFLHDTECYTNGTAGLSAGNLTCSVIAFEPPDVFIFGWFVSVGMAMPNFTTAVYASGDGSCTGGAGNPGNDCAGSCPLGGNQGAAPQCTFILPLAGPAPCPFGTYSTDDQFFDGGCDYLPGLPLPSSDCVTGTVTVS